MYLFILLSDYASPSSGEAYWDQQLTLILSFELKNVYRHVSM